MSNPLPKIPTAAKPQLRSVSADDSSGAAPARSIPASASRNSDGSDDGQELLTLERATFGQRFFATIVDGFFYGIFGALTNQLTKSLLAPLKKFVAANQTDNMGALASMIGIGLAISTVMYFFYFVYPLARTGRTLGKKLVGLRVVSVVNPGAQLSLSQATLREFVGKPLSGIVFLVGYLMALGNERRALHDYLAKTIVVQIRE